MQEINTNLQTFINRLPIDSILKIKIKCNSNPKLAKYINNKISLTDNITSININKVKIKIFNELLCYDVNDLSVIYYNHKKKQCATLLLSDIDLFELKKQVFSDYLSYEPFKNYNINLLSLASNISTTIL